MNQKPKNLSKFKTKKQKTDKDQFSTQHQLFFQTSEKMEQIPSNSVHLILTSPPYPMIKMWDDIFGKNDPNILSSLKVKKGKACFNKMHQILNKIWEECIRILTPGGLCCINIGDATRKIGKTFQIYPNHAKISNFFQRQECIQLPSVLWWKPTNSPNKFMGSGMIPSNAYVTLEHEYILIFRKGKKTRKFKPKSIQRYQSAYFWEERNNWFSDIWKDIKGKRQILAKNHLSPNYSEIRDRSAAFPLEIPFRLINMYSIYGDTVVDPFWGTGTTSLAAMLSGRNSIGYEINQKFQQIFRKNLYNLESLSKIVIQERIKKHQQFVTKQETKGKDFKYSAENYGFPVKTSQETKILFYYIENIKKNLNHLEITHLPYT